MRIWDVPPGALCRKHLLGEHRELHGLWNIITQGKKGYANHPETLRWYGYETALHARHESLIEEMERRGYNHKSPLIGKVQGKVVQDQYVDSLDDQWRILAGKDCDCPLETLAQVTEPSKYSEITGKVRERNRSKRVFAYRPTCR